MLSQAVARFQQGDRSAFTEIAAALDSDVKAKSRARSSYVPGYDVEDVEQEILLMLEQAALKFKHSFGVQFRTFFWRLAHKRIAYLQRAQGWGNRKGHHTAVYYEHLRDPNTHDDIDQDDYRLLGAYEEEGFTEVELFDILSQADVTDRERQIVRLKMEGFSNREVNEMVGGTVYTRSNGSYIGCEVDRVLSKLKKKIASALVA